MTRRPQAETKKTITCPYCEGGDIIRKGWRKKKHERVQLYFCNRCSRKFTPLLTKGKTYPLPVMLEAISRYHRLDTFEGAAEYVKEKYGLAVQPQTISKWRQDFEKYLPYRRMDAFIRKKYTPREAIVETRLQHGQIYRFCYHRAKLDCVLQEEYRHAKFGALQEFLELVVAECPHTVFVEAGPRASRFKNVFDLDGVRITRKENAAVRSARLVLQSVGDNRARHEAIQAFFLANDSVTVAAEVPVLLDREDVAHYRDKLGFTLPDLLEGQSAGIASETSVEVREAQGDRSISGNRKGNLGAAEVLTGHIDLVQVRNGAIHILDYKPRAKRQKPTDQLTLYALALARLTGLRLYHFRCAWFDDRDYFEFFPLHVVHKKKKKKGKRKKSTEQ